MIKFPEIITTIYNYNCNENAVKLLNMFSNDFETVVLDSGSDIKNENFIYYNGLFSKKK